MSENPPYDDPGLRPIPQPYPAERWNEGPELTLHTGMTEEELRANALQAAAVSWQGLSAVTDRDGMMLVTAERFLAWLKDNVSAPLQR